MSGEKGQAAAVPTPLLTPWVEATACSLLTPPALKQGHEGLLGAGCPGGRGFKRPGSRVGYPKPSRGQGGALRQCLAPTQGKLVTQGEDTLLCPRLHIWAAAAWAELHLPAGRLGTDTASTLDHLHAPSSLRHPMDMQGWGLSTAQRLWELLPHSSPREALGGDRINIPHPKKAPNREQGLTPTPPQGSMTNIRCDRIPVGRGQ